MRGSRYPVVSRCSLTWSLALLAAIAPAGAQTPTEEPESAKIWMGRAQEFDQSHGGDQQPPRLPRPKLGRQAPDNQQTPSGKQQGTRKKERIALWAPPAKHAPDEPCTGCPYRERRQMLPARQGVRPHSGARCRCDGDRQCGDDQEREREAQQPGLAPIVVWALVTQDAGQPGLSASAGSHPRSTPAG